MIDSLISGYIQGKTLPVYQERAYLLYMLVLHD